MRKFLEKAGSLIAALAIGSIALAAVPPAAMAQSPLPSYAQPEPAPPNHEDEIQGSVTSFDGRYALQIRDNRGFIDNVRLHQGTIINPTGLTLASGMRVSIYGHSEGHFFAANEIDTPYHYVPAYVWGPGPYWGVGFGYRHAWGWW